MYRKLFWILLGVVLVGAALYFSGQYLVFRESVIRAEKNLIYLQRVIKTYAEDARKIRETDIYPVSLKSLVDENYISSEDLRDLTRGFEITYFRPLDENNVSQIILSAKVGSKVVSCPIEGQLNK